MVACMFSSRVREIDLDVGRNLGGGFLAYQLGLSDAVAATANAGYGCDPGAPGIDGADFAVEGHDGIQTQSHRGYLDVDAGDGRDLALACALPAAVLPSLVVGVLLLHVHAPGDVPVVLAIVGRGALEWSTAYSVGNRETSGSGDVDLAPASSLQMEDDWEGRVAAAVVACVAIGGTWAGFGQILSSQNDCARSRKANDMGQ